MAGVSFNLNDDNKILSIKFGSLQRRCGKMGNSCAGMGFKGKFRYEVVLGQPWKSFLKAAYSANYSNEFNKFYTEWLPFGS